MRPSYRSLQTYVNWRSRATSQRSLPWPIPTEDLSRWKHIHRFPTPIQPLLQNEPHYPAFVKYSDRFVHLIDWEQKENERILRTRLSTWTLERLVIEGYTLTGLCAYWQEKRQYGRYVASFSLDAGQDLPQHKFEAGVQVLISRRDPLSEDPIKGAVLKCTPSEIKISFDAPFDTNDSLWRVDLGQSEVVFKRMKQAIHTLQHDPESPDHWNPANAIARGTPLRGALLRTFSPDGPQHEHVALQEPDDIEYAGHGMLDHHPSAEPDRRGTFSQNQLIHSWAMRYSKPNPIVLEGDPLIGLNATQTRAMALMIGQNLSLVQGPPGTGKTKTIVETIKLLKASGPSLVIHCLTQRQVHFQVSQPILVCTYTNVAVDNLAEGLAQAGLKPLRVSTGSETNASLDGFTLESHQSRHPLKPLLDRTTQQLERAIEKRGKLNILIARIEAYLRQKATEREIQTSENDPAVKIIAFANSIPLQRPLQTVDLDVANAELSAADRARESLIAKVKRIKAIMLQDIVSRSDVICTTCLTSATKTLEVTDFPVVFLDEASMSTEPASLIPLVKGCEHLALIGDHKQLPPIIVSPEAKDGGLGISLFERLTEEGVVPSIMLDIQYRMHPAISYFPATEFYDQTLHDGTIDSNGRVNARLMPPSSQHLLDNEQTGHRPSLIFLDHAGFEAAKDKSRVNMSEAHIVASVVEDLLLQNPRMRGEDIGIIAPYKAQISELKRILQRDSKHMARFVNVLGAHRAMQLKNIEVKTVDGFEGREKDVIIFSTVRNNNAGYIGFLADRRRLNVGLTRAKRGLFVVGSISTLKKGKTEDKEGDSAGADAWRRFTEYLTGEGLVSTLVGASLQRALYGNLHAVRGLAQ